MLMEKDPLQIDMREIIRLSRNKNKKSFKHEKKLPNSFRFAKGNSFATGNASEHNKVLCFLL